jgi:hypothetical protein
MGIFRIGDVTPDVSVEMEIARVDEWIGAELVNLRQKILARLIGFEATTKQVQDGIAKAGFRVGAQTHAFLQIVPKSTNTCGS